MEKKTAKQQAIEKAYGEHEFSERAIYLINADGWIENQYSDNKMNLYSSLFDSNGSGSFRLKSLSGIENNNGWIRIESEEDLPETSPQLYKVYRDKSLIGRDSLDFSYSYSSVKVGTLYNQRLITHYKPIEPELLPIY